jgi:hypothetical protein
VLLWDTIVAAAITANIPCVLVDLSRFDGSGIDLKSMLHAANVARQTPHQGVVNCPIELPSNVRHLASMFLFYPVAPR